MLKQASSALCELQVKKCKRSQINVKIPLDGSRSQDAFMGGLHYVRSYMSVMDVLRWMKYGYPDLFIITTNPSWPELKDILFSYASKIQQKIVATSLRLMP